MASTASRLDVSVEVGTVDESIRVTGANSDDAGGAHRCGQPRRSDAPRVAGDVQVLSGDEIRERGDRTLEDAETRMVGVTTQGSLGNGGGVRMSRGFGGVQFDGPPV